MKKYIIAILMAAVISALSGCSEDIAALEARKEQLLLEITNLEIEYNELQNMVTEELSKGKL